MHINNCDLIFEKYKNFIQKTKLETRSKREHSVVNINDCSANNIDELIDIERMLKKCIDGLKLSPKQLIELFEDDHVGERAQCAYRKMHEWNEYICDQYNNIKCYETIVKGISVEIKEDRNPDERCWKISFELPGDDDVEVKVIKISIKIIKNIIDPLDENRIITYLKKFAFHYLREKNYDFDAIEEEWINSLPNINDLKIY